MPTSTFFRLPEEKRQRLLDAAWTEFSQTRFTNASINRIIHSAHIPRGSFYQYFLDKDDLFYYLLEELKDHFSGVLAEMLRQAKGDLFQLPVRAYARFNQKPDRKECYLDRALSILRNNLGMDLQKLLMERPTFITEDLLGRVDMSHLQRRDPAFVSNVITMLLMVTASAVMETIAHPDQGEEQLRLLEDRVEIIKYGSLVPQTAGIA